ncbi:hypothetical protein [Pseudoxanthomonas sp. Root630]|uniref:hypothetical protein n=1 Tax=Pseudoxanthomonas sp. Root630 TaxID=1736574 RepID=UPI000702D939|nr:hypothetical protein [Pseudoxanthomonas sp. Root630]KRA44494.1 hypothetical protein ASD72_10915 [Pseudoxanthomonas sp. Root630]
MKTPHEPLTPEERALAQSLSRLGPHGGPSPGLDARILGAARAAVQESPAPRGGTVPPVRRRWPLGLGVAASVLLAAGIAWQLRPTHEMLAASEVPVLAKHDAAVMSAPAEQAADAAAVPEMDAAAAAPAAEPYEPPPPIRQLAPPKVEATPAPSSPARRNAEAAARQEAPPKRGPLSMIPAVPGLPAPAEPAFARKTTTPQAFPEAVEDRAAAAADFEERAQQQQARQRASAEQQREQQLRSESERRASEAKAAADTSDSLDAVMVTGSRISRQDGFVAAPAAAPPPPPPAPAASAGAASPSVARNALRRTDLQVPVDEDARLTPAEWLDRIRLRRDLGDNANALRSLQLFVQEHPFQRVPDDLRPLLGTP